MGIINLDDIPNGSLCVIDTNVLLYAEQAVSAQAQRLLRRCASVELIGTLPQTVWQEVTHKLMLAEALMLGKVSGLSPARQLSRKPEVVRSLGLYRQKVQALLDLGLGFEPCTRDDLAKEAFRYQEHYGLLTNDSVVLAVALRLRADVLASADESFRSVSEIQVACPTDLKPGL
ncbi:MAG: type II toxin-antitoxin system VapC family toxin [Acidobacteria bacterium]|nr:type II toxin-antitoxin system VapC family toxin [Acidobacteriota bacterium]